MTRDSTSDRDMLRPLRRIGTGVHPDDAARVLEKFGRGRDGAGRKLAGAGLGLYLSRRILQAHGSELTLDSEPGGGSVFGFELEAVT